MNVASAYTVGNAPTAFMATRTSEAERSGAETGTPTRFSAGQETVGALKARYPIVALSYDQDASRLVMLFRDPATGDAVAQIPSKVVVRQYREAQSEKDREERRKFEVIVGGAEEGRGPSIGEKLAGDGGKSAAAGGAVANPASPAPSGGAFAAPAVSAAVSASSPAPVSSSAAVGSGGASGLNLVV
ncbi:MAG TPA: hypothetical protein PKZ97_08955 [Azospirillaceae bacterium]|nr:hypothetical protein [Azospirillaceae bacterium]